MFSGFSSQDLEEGFDRTLDSSFLDGLNFDDFTFET